MRIEDVVNISLQVLDALAALHAARLVHTDISFENIVVRRDPYTQLYHGAVIDFNSMCDWGGSFEDGMVQKRREKGGPYGAPEALITGALDVFAFGYIFNAWIHANFSSDERVSSRALLLMLDLCEIQTSVDFTKRPTAQECRDRVMHAWWVVNEGT